VAAPAQELEALVREELRGPLTELVRPLIPGQLNGYQAATAEAVTAAAPETSDTLGRRASGAQSAARRKRRVHSSVAGGNAANADAPT
jgi:hypothetical protein